MPTFQLPPDWYRRTIEDLVDNQLPPLLGPLTFENAWRYVYATVAWLQPVRGQTRNFLHLNDRLDSIGGRAEADVGEAWLRANLAPAPVADIAPLIDHIGRAYEAERVRQGGRATWQRNNVTGNAFEFVIQVLLDRLCGVVAFRQPPLNTLRGFQLAPLGYHSRPDLIVYSPEDFRVLISTKWTLRKERLGTFLHEAFFYRQRRPDLGVAFVVNEFSLSILDHLANDPLVDRVYHVSLPMLLSVHEPFPGVAAGASVPKAQLLGAENATLRKYRRWVMLRRKVRDLSDFFRDVCQGATAPAGVTPLGETDDQTAEGDEDLDA
jgi:hypothetical protein